MRFANFEGISAFSVPSIILAETHVYLHELKRSLFVIRDWWISIRFVPFMFQGSLLCDRPVSGNNRLVIMNLLRRFFWSFLFLSLARIKQRLPPSFEKNPLTIAISFAILEQSRVSEHVTL